MEYGEAETQPELGPAYMAAPEAVALSRALVEGTRDDVLVADPAGQIQFISPGLARAAGATPGELVGEPADRALSVMQLPSFSNLKGMLATVSSARTEAELVDENGERRTVLLRGVATRRPDGRSRYVWFVTPLSRVRTYEWASRLMQSELQTQSRILALVSHELRTPLNIILAQLALLQEGIRGELGAEQLDCVDRASRASHDLLRQVNDLIDLANLESRQVEARTEPLSPDRLVGLARTTAREVLGETDLPWEVIDELPAGIRVVADPQRTAQILSKLLANSRKFSGDQAAGVRLTLHVPDSPSPSRPGGASSGGVPDAGRPDAFAAVDVWDAGTGIPEDQRDRIFEPFQQNGDVLSRRSGGSGIGLSIARRLARLQDGELTAGSASPRGTVFRLYLPLSG